MSILKKNRINLNKFGPKYNLISFSTHIKHIANKQQLVLMNYFETFGYKNIIE